MQKGEAAWPQEGEGIQSTSSEEQLHENNNRRQTEMEQCSQIKEAEESQRREAYMTKEPQTPHCVQKSGMSEAPQT